MDCPVPVTKMVTLHFPGRCTPVQATREGTQAGSDESCCAAVQCCCPAGQEISQAKTGKAEARQAPFSAFLAALGALQLGWDHQPPLAAWQPVTHTHQIAQKAAPCRGAFCSATPTGLHACAAVACTNIHMEICGWLCMH